jgi:hypothetical protein
MRRGPRYALENGQVALKGACYEGLSLWVREWLEDMASYRLFVEPYLQRITHDEVELYIKVWFAAVNLGKERYGVATLIPVSTAFTFFSKSAMCSTGCLSVRPITELKRSALSGFELKFNAS